MIKATKPITISNRFSGYLPIVVDLETSGLDCNANAILEIAAHSVDLDATGKVVVKNTFHAHLTPFPGAVLDPKALEFLNPHLESAFRLAISEHEACQLLYDFIETEITQANCRKAVIVAHNASFDHGFLLQAFKRNAMKINFHSFSVIDTASLTNFILGENVLIKACRKMKIKFDEKLAHGALYDATKTAELFCLLANKISLHY